MDADGGLLSDRRMTSKTNSGPPAARTALGRPCGHAVAAARTLLGLSQRQLAEISGVSYGALQRFEGGKVGSRLETYDRIVRALSDRGIRFLEEDDTVATGFYLSKATGP